MAKKNKIDLTELSVEELYERINEEQGKFVKLRFNHAVAQLENPLTLRHIRRDIARLKTELRVRELNNK